MKHIFSFLLFLATSASFAQVTFEPGYFISGNGTRTECLIRNVDWTNNPQSFEWKLNEEGESQTKKANEVAEFSVGANKFRKFVVNMDRSGVVLNELSTVKDPQWVTETLFLSVLVEGKVTLYEFKDGNIQRFFFSTGDHKTAEQLVYKQYKQDSYVKENAFFRQQLYMLMQDKMTNADYFKRIAYKKRPLIKLFESYTGNESFKAPVEETVSTKGSFNIKVTPGISLGTLEINNTNQNQFLYFENLDNKISSKIAIRLGAEAEYILPRLKNKWSVFADPNVQLYKATNSNTKPLGKNMVTYSWEAKYTFIEVPVGIRHYMYLNIKSKLFVDAAYVLTMTPGSSSIEYTQDHFNGASYNGSLNVKKSTSGFAAGAGYSYDNYSIEIRYTTSENVIDYPTWEATYSSIGVILGYKIL